MTKENRNFKRTRIEIRIRLKESDTDIAASFNVRDLSEGGMFIQSPLLWEPGERFELAFTLPGTNYEIRAKGEVARAMDKYLLAGDPTGEPIPGMGIHFTDITDTDRQNIREFIARLQSG